MSETFAVKQFHLLPIFAIFLAVVSISAWLRRDRRLDKLPGPKGYPLIGIGISLPPKAPARLREWASMYGEVFKMRVGWYNWVVINSPQAFREILDKQSMITSSKIPAPIGDDVVTRGMRQFTMPYGPKWRSYRTISHQLLSSTMTASFIPAQEYEAKQLLVDLATKNTNQRDFYQHLRRYSFSVIMTSTYGTRVSHWDHEDVHHAVRSSQILGKITQAGAFIVDELPILALLPTWLQPGRKHAEAISKPLLEAKMRLWRRMQAQLATGKAPTCYAREMMEKSESWRSEGLTDEDVAWNLGGIVDVASHTSSVTLANLVNYLGANLNVQQIAHDELMRVVGPNRTPVLDDIKDLPYVHACVKEVLRLCPTPIWGIKHYADADVKYKNYIIPKGTVLLANTSFIHYDPERYNEPFAFQPERYLNFPKYSSEYAAQSDPYKRDHFAFGAGRRICPGARLAENSLNIALANILWAFEIRPPIVDGLEAKGMDLSDDAYENTSFRGLKPFAARFVPRRDDRLEFIKKQWEEAARNGYTLKGNDVDVNGVVKY